MEWRPFPLVECAGAPRWFGEAEEMLMLGGNWPEPGSPERCGGPVHIVAHYAATNAVRCPYDASSPGQSRGI